MPRKSPIAKPRRKGPPKVALLIETSNSYARGLLEGIEDYILGHGPWSVYLGEHGRGDKPPDWITRWKGDGIIARIENPLIAGPLRKTRIPIVDVSAPRLVSRAPTVTTDNAAVARMAVQHFTERGFRHFAYCGDARFAWSVARGESFSLLIRDIGYDCNIYESPGLGMESEAESEHIGKWLLSLPKPVAVFACYDARGQLVLDACRRVSLAVPEEVAVLGVDNDELICALSPPPLSSINLDKRRAGWEAAALLAEMMDGGKVAPEIHRIAPLGVVTRKSTDVLAVDDPPVTRALHYIREHACEGIGVGDVLHHCPMSRRILEGKLKTLLGRTPREEIVRVQLNCAKEMLSGTELPRAEIAARAGFKHTEYFSFVFKRETGVTPSAWRKDHRARR